MKIAIAGKGGAGKTTLSAGLARSFAEEPRQVLAVDADSNNCLGYALGFPAEILQKVTPLSDMKDTLKERAESGGGGFFLLAPEVGDLLDAHAVTHNGIRLLVMGTVTEPGGGCVCPESVVLRALTRSLVSREEVVILDLEAGVEHLGRGTAQHMDWLIVVTDANPAGIRTAQRIVPLAQGLGVPKIGIVANRIRTLIEAEYICNSLAGRPCLGAIPFDPLLDNAGVVPWENAAGFRHAVGEIKAHLTAVDQGQK